MFFLCLYFSELFFLEQAFIIQADWEHCSEGHSRHKEDNDIETSHDTIINKKDDTEDSDCRLERIERVLRNKEFLEQVFDIHFDIHKTFL